MATTRPDPLNTMPGPPLISTSSALLSAGSTPLVNDGADGGEPAGYRARAHDRRQGLADLSAAVGPQRDVWGQQLHERVDVATRCGGGEPLGDLLLLRPVGGEARSPGLHMLAGAVRGLAHCGFGTRGRSDKSGAG
ncbi:hypothetical protein ACWDKQ_19405 [Saccharopolyspora sp. NPDC000995]